TRGCDAAQTRSNRAAIGLCADQLHLNPRIVQARIATNQLGWSVNAIHDEVDVAIVVEVSKSAPARRRGCAQPRAANFRHVLEFAVAQVAVKQLWLRVASLGMELLRLGVHVAIAEQDVRPAIIVEIEKAAPPTEILRMLPEACGKRGVFKRVISNV